MNPLGLEAIADFALANGNADVADAVIAWSKSNLTENTKIMKRRLFYDLQSKVGNLHYDDYVDFKDARHMLDQLYHLLTDSEIFQHENTVRRWAQMKYKLYFQECLCLVAGSIDSEIAEDGLVDDIKFANDYNLNDIINEIMDIFGIRGNYNDVNNRTVEAKVAQQQFRKFDQCIEEHEVVAPNVSKQRGNGKKAHTTIQKVFNIDNIKQLYIDFALNSFKIEFAKFLKDIEDKTLPIPFINISYGGHNDEHNKIKEDKQLQSTSSSASKAKYNTILASPDWNEQRSMREGPYASAATAVATAPTTNANVLATASSSFTAAILTSPVRNINHATATSAAKAVEVDTEQIIHDIRKNKQIIEDISNQNDPLKDIVVDPSYASKAVVSKVGLQQQQLSLQQHISLSATNNRKRGIAYDDENNGNDYQPENTIAKADYNEQDEEVDGSKSNNTGKIKKPKGGNVASWNKENLQVDKVAFDSQEDEIEDSDGELQRQRKGNSNPKNHSQKTKSNANKGSKGSNSGKDSQQKLVDTAAIIASPAMIQQEISSTSSTDGLSAITQQLKQVSTNPLNNDFLPTHLTRTATGATNIVDYDYTAAYKGLDGPQLRIKWSIEEEEVFLSALQKHGAGKWREILDDVEYKEILQNRDNVQLKDKYRNMLKKGTIVTA